MFPLDVLFISSRTGLQQWVSIFRSNIWLKDYISDHRVPPRCSLRIPEIALLWSYEIEKKVHGQAGNTETAAGEGGLTIQVFRVGIAIDAQYLITRNCTLSYIFIVHVILNALTENGHLWPHCRIIFKVISTTS